MMGEDWYRAVTRQRLLEERKESLLGGTDWIEVAPSHFEGETDQDGRMRCQCGSIWWVTQVVFLQNGAIDAMSLSGVTCGQCGAELTLAPTER
jgi:hypothetical protein